MTFVFRPTETLYTFTPLPAAHGLPKGWLLRMPMAGQYVSVELFSLQPGVRGAYRIRVSEKLPVDEWEKAAMEVMHSLACFMVTDRDSITEHLAHGMAREFHFIWTTGVIAPEIAVVHVPYPIEAAAKGMRWVRAHRHPNARNHYIRQ
ncbi:hypothetical protein QA648_00420 [Rhizobium sp. CB3171]|uniref:hypothetical protein n=1 Tax=Rhizobium sp. CB3171 TaxID=3039157 RepID=UPI0024B06067|nr:hypothetical protein [Rhizobium sp. CB3171]WFU02284.1 hypothetical protein QA648_00420 [Rhizobium sp. CB3171]